MSPLATVLLLVLQLLAGGAPWRVVERAVVAGAEPAASWRAAVGDERAAPLHRSQSPQATEAARTARPTPPQASSAPDEAPRLAAPTPVVGRRTRPATHAHAVAARGEHLPYYPTAPPSVG